MEPACCSTRAVVVPLIGYAVDVGLPIVLLIASYLYLRSQRAKRAAAPETPPTALPLLETEQTDPRLVQLDVAALPAEAAAPGVTKRVLQWLRRTSGTATPLSDRQDSEARLVSIAALAPEAALAAFQTPAHGLPAAEAAARLLRDGPNKPREVKPPGLLRMAFNSSCEPFNALMAVVAILTISPPNSDVRTFALVMVLLAMAVVLRFIEEVRSARTSRTLATGLAASVQVMRDGKLIEVPIEQTVVGDVVHLSGNDLVPGDVRILEAHNLQIGMASLTGEAFPVPKSPEFSGAGRSVLEHGNIALQSTSVVSGTAKCLVVATGSRTFAAGIAAALPPGRQTNAFDLAIRRVVYLFIAFLVVMVPLVIIISGLTTGSWSGAVALGLSVAVGLSPQAMPLLVAANLSRSANQLRARGTAIRRLDAVQNLGAMDVLCTDKTGTLTEDEVVLVQHLDAEERSSEHLLRLAFLNAHYQEAKGNAMDEGIKRFAAGVGLQDSDWLKLGELPFDFERRMLSVILQPAQDAQADSLLICKGAFDEVLLKCTHVQLEAGPVVASEAIREKLLSHCAAMNAQGLRVLAVATRSICKAQADFTLLDEADLLFNGFLAFLDPPKLAAQPAIQRLTALGIQTKVLTGDSLLVAKHVASELGIPTGVCVSGAQLALMEDAAFEEVVEHATVFAKVTPQQKMAIVASLQRRQHIVGAMGDGTNDGLMLRKADVGVCVDTGTDVAKEAADMIMLDKDLDKLAFGVRMGRVTYGNTIKYIKASASSSFGNTFSILVGSAWLPFNPLAPIQVLALNLLYNVSQLAIPWDHMDETFTQSPKRWRVKTLGLYMLIIGPTSSIFDVTTFLISWYVFKANNASDAAAKLFSSIWFLESLMTQTTVIHLLRTERVPFLQSRAAWPLMVSTFGTMAVGFAICYIPEVNKTLQLEAPPPLYYGMLAATVAAYFATVQVFKVWYVSVFNNWL